MFKFLANVLQGRMPYFYNTLLRPLEVHHRYGTRNHSFRQPLITSEVVRRSISPQLITMFNSLPPEINILTVSAPKALRMYKRILLNTQ